MDVSNAVRQAQIALDAARQSGVATTKNARNALQTAQANLQKLRIGARPQEIAQAQSAVTQAQATLDRAVTEVERVQLLFEKGIRARRDLDDAQTARRLAEASLQSARDALSLLQAGTRPEELRAAQLSVAGAREALVAAQESGANQVLQAQSALQLARDGAKQAAQQRPEDVRAALLRVQAAEDALRQAQASAQAKIESARASLQAASQGGLTVAAKGEDARAKLDLAASKAADLQSAQIAATTFELRAPISGIVSKRSGNAGDLADPATPIIEITNSGALGLIANLPAESGAGVRAGQNARVQAESAPGRTFAAQVMSVGQIDPQSGLLSVQLIVPNPNNALKVGALASCEIVVSRRAAAVAVPRQAVITREGKPRVYVQNGDKAASREVTLGEENGDWTEIRRGVKPGERVIRLGQYELEDGAPVKLAASKATN